MMPARVAVLMQRLRAAVPRPGSARELLRSRVARQVLALFGSGLLFLVGGIVANVLNTHLLDPTAYGNYSFAFALTDYVILFIDFGFYSSGARVLAMGEMGKGQAPQGGPSGPASPAGAVTGEPAPGEALQKERRELIGALVFVGGLLCLAAGLIMFCVSFLAGPVLHTAVGPSLRIFSILFGAMSLQALVEAVCRGDNRIGALSLYRVGIKLLNVLLILAAAAVIHYTFTAALVVNLVAYLAVSVVLVAWVRPLWSGLRRSLSVLVKDVKVYGWHAYLGNIANTASSKTDSILISAFADAASVGYYNLGTIITFPMATFSRSLATTLFKDFTRQDRIPRRVIQANLAWLLCCTAFLAALAAPLVHLLFSPRYDPVIPLILPLAVTAMLSGAAIPYNMFLGAKGMGTYLRNTAIIMAVLNLSLNVLLIPRFKAMGAAIATLIALAINLGLHLYYYRKTLARLAALRAAEAGGSGRAA